MIARAIVAWWQDLAAALAAADQSAPDRSGARWLDAWAIVCITAGASLYVACGYHAGFDRLNAFAYQWPPWIWQWLTAFGDERAAFALTLFFSRRRPRVFWTLVLAALIGIAFTHGIKPAVGAIRPPGVLDADAFNLIGPGHRHKSFPSGHSVTAGVFFGVWVYYARSSALRVLLIIAAVAVGFSRIAVGVHWPIDVAVGLFGGIIAARVGVLLAARSVWGTRDPSVHLAFVTLAVMLTATLLLWDGGYAGAADMQWWLGAIALVYALIAYLVRPVMKELSRQRRAAH